MTALLKNHTVISSVRVVLGLLAVYSGIGILKNGGDSLKKNLVFIIKVFDYCGAKYDTVK